MNGFTPNRFSGIRDLNRFHRLVPPQEKFELAVEQWLVVNASDVAVAQSEGFRQRSRLARRKRTRVVESLRNAALYTLEWAAKMIFTIPDRLIKGGGGFVF